MTYAWILTTEELEAVAASNECAALVKSASERESQERAVEDVPTQAHVD